MTETTTGLILRVRPLTDTSLIVHWLTRDFGRIATVARGARRNKSSFAGKLDLFYEADLSFQRSRRSELHALREVSLKEVHAALRRELGSLRQAAYCVALIEQTTESDTPVPAIHTVMIEIVRHLETHPPEPQTVFAFELKLLRELGLEPDIEQDITNAGVKSILKMLLAGDWPAIGRLKLAPAQVTSITHYLHNFLIQTVGRALPAREKAIN